MPDQDRENVKKSSIKMAQGSLTQIGLANRPEASSSPVAGWQADETKYSPLALQPIKRSAMQSAEDAEALTTRNSEPQTSCRPLRILLAEDSKINQMIAVKMLEQQGHTVVAVDNGRLALEAHAKERFDLVLMDVQMPEMTGIEAVTAIRERERSTGARIPIIALTAHTMEGDKQQCLESGMDSYVSKPIRVKELLQCIAELLPCPAPDQFQANIIDQPPTGDLLDHSALLDSLNGNKMLLQALVRLFMKKCPDLVANIDSAILSNDANSLERAAHKLKGSSNLLTGPALIALKHLEQMGREGDLQNAQNELSALQMEIERAEPELIAILSENIG